MKTPYVIVNKRTGIHWPTGAGEALIYTCMDDATTPYGVYRAGDITRGLTMSDILRDTQEAVRAKKYPLKYI